MIVLKKGKIFTKRHIVVATLAVMMAAAVWLNMRFSTLPSDDLQQDENTDFSNGQFLSGDTEGAAIQVSSGVSYIRQARSERNIAREDSVNNLKNTIEASDLDEKSKKDALQSVVSLTENAQKETDIETVIKSKGFDDALVMISDDNVTVIVPSEGLLASQTLQIQDAVASQIKIDLEKIKIICVK